MAPTPDSAPLQPAETPPLLRPHTHPGNLPRTTVIFSGKPRTATPEWKCLSAKLTAQLVQNQQSSQTSRNRSHRRKSGRGSRPDPCTRCSLWQDICQDKWNKSICTTSRTRYLSPRHNPPVREIRLTRQRMLLSRFQSYRQTRWLSRSCNPVYMILPTLFYSIHCHIRCLQQKNSVSVPRR